MRIRAALVALLASAAPAVADPLDDLFRHADCVARTVYWEARGASRQGMMAVAQVVMNRASDPRWPSDPCEVVFQRHRGRCQFSWTCTALRDRRPQDNPAWRQSQEVAMEALSGVRGPVGRAIYFQATWVEPRRSRQIALIDGHRFYAD